MTALKGVAKTEHVDCPCGKQNRDDDRKNPDPLEVTYTGIDIINIYPRPAPGNGTRDTNNTKNNHRMDRHPVRRRPVVGIGKRHRIGQKQHVEDGDLTCQGIDLGAHQFRLVRPNFQRVCKTLPETRGCHLSET